MKNNRGKGALASLPRALRDAPRLPCRIPPIRGISIHQSGEAFASLRRQDAVTPLGVHWCGVDRGTALGKCRSLEGMGRAGDVGEAGSLVF